MSALPSTLWSLILPEIWKPIPSNPKYLVSSEGNVRHRDSNKLCKLHPNNNARYLAVGFWQDGKIRRRNVHVLVAEAFKGPRPNGKEVRHLDGNGHNNKETNLCYGTKKENGQDKIRHGTNCPGERNGNAALSDSDTELMRVLYARGDITQYQLADLFGISQAQVNNIVLNKQRVTHLRAVA